MKRLFAAVAISALTLSTAAFAADNGAVQKPVDQKAQVPAVTAPTVPGTASPAKPMADDGKAKTTVKKEKTSLNVQRPARVQMAQASGATVAPSKSTTDSAAAPAKKAATVKKSDGKGSTEAAPATSTKPATH